MIFDSRSQGSGALIIIEATVPVVDYSDIFQRSASHELPS
jgi:hypothetical protein